MSSILDKDLDVSKLKVADLKKELKSRGLSAEGKKNELIERLQTAIGDSALLDDTVGDHDDILDEDVLSDEDEVLQKSDDKEEEEHPSMEKTDMEISLKRKAETDKEESPVARPAKKIVLNRTILSMEKEESVTDENGDKSEKVTTKLQALSKQELLEQRAAKFGSAATVTDKKAVRAARFGIETPTTPTPISATASAPSSVKPASANIDVLKKRADRFGTTLPGSVLEKAEIEEKKRKRMERFGAVDKTTEGTNKATVKAKVTVQSSELDEKMRLRAKRFQLTS